MHASLKWINKMYFECHNDGHVIPMDALPEHGGEAKGPSPKELLLDAMMGCTAMDTRSLLNKMRQNIHTLELEIDAEKTTEIPVHFKSALIKFHLQGEGQQDKIIKAVTKSLTQYCGVNYMMSKTCDIRFEIYFNDEKVHAGRAEFIL